MVERKRALRLLNVLLDALGDLRRYGSQVKIEDLREQRDAQNMVLHALYLAIQSAIDLSFHIIADEGLPRPTSYQQAFLELGDAGLLDAGLARRLAGWAGLRNVVAHSYPVIDLDRVHRAIREELGDLEEFARQTERLASLP